MLQTTDTRQLAERAAAELEGASAADVLTWAVDAVPRLAVTSSFGADSPVLLHLMSEIAPHLPVLFLDTGYHFAESLAYRRALAARLGLTVVDVRPQLTVADQDAIHGPRLHDREPDACCRMRKTEPLRRALADFDGWATGIRRGQTPERAGTAVVEASPLADRWLLKVSPLARWSAADVEAYLDRHDLPRHPLVARGYRSIGCAPCTVPVDAGGDPRAGRWAGTGKTECGIHVAHDGLLRPRDTG